jgi:hypothetical protein
VEVASSLHRDGTEIDRDVRRGVYISFEARTDYAVQCFAEYGALTDETGHYGAPFVRTTSSVSNSAAASPRRGAWRTDGCPIGSAATSFQSPNSPCGR